MRTPRFWYIEDSFAEWALSLALTPFSWLYYRISKEVRSQVKPYKCGIPVICIGNLVAGGAGKTPSTLALVKLLKKQGLNPHVISRGYGGSIEEPTKVDPKKHTSEEVGDEPLLMAHEGLTVWVSQKRKKSAYLAEKDGADLLIMDDGFQNNALHKDFSFLAFDGLLGFGNHALIPAGPLREPVEEGIKRAQAIIQIDDDLKSDLTAINLPKIRADFRPLNTELSGEKVYPFAGMGRPEKFLRTLHLMNCNITGFDMFPDHYKYKKIDIRTLVQNANNKDAHLVTTRKDFYRIPEEFRPHIKVLDVELVWADEKALLDLLNPILKAKKTSPSKEQKTA